MKKTKDKKEEQENKIITFFKEVVPYFVIILAVILFRTYIATPVRVDGNSMYPTFQNGQILLLKKYDKEYERFQVIVFNHGSAKFVKRVIGLPGDKISYKDNKLYVNDLEVPEMFGHEKTADFEYETIIPEDTYFVLGDNRTDSLDSRIIGVINKKDIDGIVCYSIFPFKQVI